MGVKARVRVRTNMGNVNQRDQELCRKINTLMVYAIFTVCNYFRFTFMAYTTFNHPLHL
jgi:hypothetical protein